jgi:hypothetical protein
MFHTLPRIVIATSLVICCSAQYFARDLAPNQWKGRRELVVFDFGSTTEEVPNGPAKTYQSGLWTQFSYDIYQNNLEVVRYVLTRLSGARKSSVADFGDKLVDYPNKSVLVFRGQNPADRSPLMRAQATSTGLEGRHLLGFDCEGVDVRYVDRNGFKHVRQSWTPTRTTFRDPLLEIGYIYDPDGSLSEISLGAVTLLENVQSLDGTLFETPKDMKVNNISP